MIAPTSPAEMIGTVISVSSKKPPEIVFATSVARQAQTRLSTAARMTAVRGRSAPGSDRARHGVGAVVEPVGVIEDEGYGDDRDDDE